MAQQLHRVKELQTFHCVSLHLLPSFPLCISFKCLCDKTNSNAWVEDLGFSADSGESRVVNSKGVCVGTAVDHSSMVYV